MNPTALTALIDPGVFDQMVSVRRELHRHPELSWRETKTAARVCVFLDRLDIPYRSNVAGTGVVAQIPGRGAGPVVALRADLDALPIKEETGLDFASTIDGVMHACGHDGHTSMLLGAAALLCREDLPLPVRLIFQPAEETGEGAKAMVDAGVLDDVAMIFGGHLDRHYPTGSVVVTDGVVNASSDRFRIEIAGKGGHAARPHESVDAIVVGSLMVMAIQTIVSREVNPAHPSVVTVGRFDAGTAANVIAARAVLEGSIRAQDKEVQQALHQSIRRIAQSVGQLHGAHVEVEISLGTPPLLNQADMTDLARNAAAEVVGPEQVLEMITANMGGEDFSYFTEQVPGCYVRIGAIREGEENFPAHSSRFDFDEQALAVGAAYYSAVARLAGQRISTGRNHD